MQVKPRRASDDKEYCTDCAALNVLRDCSTIVWITAGIFLLAEYDTLRTFKLQFWASFPVRKSCITVSSSRFPEEDHGVLQRSRGHGVWDDVDGMMCRTVIKAFSPRHLVRFFRIAGYQIYILTESYQLLSYLPWTGSSSSKEVAQSKQRCYWNRMVSLRIWYRSESRKTTSITKVFSHGWCLCHEGRWRFGGNHRAGPCRHPLLVLHW